MPVNPIEFFDFALQCSGGVKKLPFTAPEISLRMSAARAYYYMYHSALAAANRKQVDRMSENAGAHEKLILWYRMMFETTKNNTYKKLAKVLEDTREYRCKAEYDIGRPWNPSNNTNVFRLVENYDRYVSALPANDKCDQNVSCSLGEQRQTFRVVK